MSPGQDTRRRHRRKRKAHIKANADLPFGRMGVRRIRWVRRAMNRLRVNWWIVP